MAGRRLTDEQQALVERNFGLVPVMVHRVAERDGYLDHDSLMSEASYAICMAATTWRPEGARFSTYACRAMIFAMRRHIRRERKRLDAVSVADPAYLTTRSNHERAAEVVDELCMLLVTVTPRTQRVMLAHYGEGRPNSEIGGWLGVSATTVRRMQGEGVRIARNTARRERSRMAERICA